MLTHLRSRAECLTWHQEAVLQSRQQAGVRLSVHQTPLDHLEHLAGAFRVYMDLRRMNTFILTPATITQTRRAGEFNHSLRRSVLTSEVHLHFSTSQRNPDVCKHMKHMMSQQENLELAQGRRWIVAQTTVPVSPRSPGVCSLGFTFCFVRLSQLIF